MGKTVKLSDGTEVVIRELTKEDVNKSYAFFKALSPEDRLYLRVNVQDKKVVVRG